MRSIIKLTARHLELDLPDNRCGSATIVACVLETEILSAPMSVVLKTYEESSVVALKLGHVAHPLLAAPPARR